MSTMKTIGRIWLFPICAILTGCNGQYEITGKTNIIPDGETIFLQKQDNQQFEIIDSTTVNNGSFFFKGRQQSPAIAILVPADNHKSNFPPLLLALEAGKISVTFDSIAHISGTPLNDRLQNYQNKRRIYDRQIQQITALYIKDYLSGQLTDSTFGKLKKEFERAQKGLETLTRNYIAENTDNVTSVYLFLQNSFLFSPEEQRTLIAEAAPVFKKNPAIVKVSLMLNRMKNVEPGMPYIDIPLQTIDGQAVTLSKYIDNGKYVLLDFWASWCPPCRKQTPFLKQLYTQYDKQQFSIVGISFDTNLNEWREYIDKNQIAWPQLDDPEGWESDAILTYAIQGIPHFVLVGPDGKIVANNPSEQQLDEILENRLTPQ